MLRIFFISFFCLSIFTRAKKLLTYENRANKKLMQNNDFILSNVIYPNFYFRGFF